ncbi:MAG TPA: protein kinase [Vicinamibacterales bacterium]|nr:protein kinase [Vicinamibacterales bacterium]
MALITGSRLGPYEIVAALGAGGMGEVYRATDTRLARTVAIKVLPQMLAADPQFRDRFEREARVVSQLNHPNICTLYDIGEQNGTAFLVMELLEGETLADRIRKGPLTVDQVLDYAMQIADALDKAHRQGIIHRDLKPANVMLVRGGSGSVPSTCKLLDFGLAKIGAIAGSGIVETRMVTSPVPSAGGTPLTAQGSILGTFQYMAPEQVEGQEVDGRADLWAFGCVVYEMITGRPPFEGKSHASLIAAILEREPRPMSELQPMTPPALGRVVRTCLAKNPSDRFQTAHDLWLQLQWIEEGGSAAGLPPPVIAHRRHRDRAVWLTVAAIVGLAGAALAWWLKPAPPVTRVVSRFEYLLPEAHRFSRSGRHVVAISPDGTKLAYVANQQLFLRPMDQLDAQPIRGSDQDPIDPVFSPDGQWLAYFVAPKGSTGRFSLRKISVAGGAPVTLAETAASHGVSWVGSTIVFGQNEAGKDSTITAVPDTGGAPRVLVTVAARDGRATQPQLLDGGRHVLFNVRPLQDAPDNEGQIVVQGLDGGPRIVLAENGRNPRRLPSGHLVFFRNGTLLAVAVDWDRFALAGGPVPVVEGVAGAAQSWIGQFDISRNGTMVYRPGAVGNNELQPAWVDRTGREQPLAARAAAYQRVSLSPQGDRIAAVIAGDEQDVWVWDIAKETMTRLTFGPAAEGSPQWTPDGRHVVFMSRSETGEVDIFRRAADGTGVVEPVTKDGAGGAPLSFSPDGRQLLFRKQPAGGGADLALLSIGSAPSPLLANPGYNEQNGVISPDGRWIAYESNETAAVDIYVRPFPEVETGRWKISDGGGVRPMWSRSGRELFYTSIVDTARLPLMAVAISSGASFVSGKPQELFSVTPYTATLFASNYDHAPDGRFLFMKATGPGDAGGRQRFIVVSNWIDDVSARVK